MIIERTSYPWTPSGVLFSQKIGDGKFTYDLRVEKLRTDRNGVIVRTYDSNGKLTAIDRYYYNALFHYVQAVIQIFYTDFGVLLDWFGKFLIVDENGNIIND